MNSSLYTHSVLQSASSFFFALATILFAGALVTGWVAGKEPVSPRKGRAKFFSYACVGLAFIALGIPLMMHQAARRALPFAGTITAVQQTGGKASHATLHVRLDDGGELVLHTDGRSPYFRPNQAVRGLYASTDDTLLSAKFLDKNGAQQGVFHGRSIFLLPYGILLLGVFIVFAGWLLYRRDPEGANVARRTG